MKNIGDYIMSIPDYPKKGIIFRDITPVPQDPDGFELAVDQMLEKLDGVEFDAIAALESRGFIFAAPMAYKLHKSLVMIRKKGKLPRKTVSQRYDLEYGEAEIEIHTDAIKQGQRVILVDDLLATGGTLDAAAKLTERLGGEVAGIVCLIELEGLGGREKLSKYRCESLIKYAETAD